MLCLSPMLNSFGRRLFGIGLVGLGGSVSDSNGVESNGLESNGRHSTPQTGRMEAAESPEDFYDPAIIYTVVMVRSFPFSAALALIGTTAITVGAPSVMAQGSLFTAAPVDQSRFIVVAAPIGKGERSQLNIYEQRSSKRDCFAVSGSSPAVVDPLLATFDFTGICNRYIDGNGYSLRIGADDLGTRYRLSVVKVDGDVHLLAAPTGNPSDPRLVVAKTGGSGSGYLQLQMEPGWQLMRRQYGEKTLGHLYVYRDSWPGSSVESTQDETELLDEQLVNP